MYVFAFALDDLPSWLPNSTASTLLFINFCLQVAIGLRVIMQRRPTGETLAWIMVVFSMPLLGPLVYLVLGELAVGAAPRREVHRAHQTADVVAARHP